MRISDASIVGYKVLDELPFTVSDIEKAAIRIEKQDDVEVYDWPVTIDFRYDMWELWFLRPVSDETLEAYLFELDND